MLSAFRKLLARSENSSLCEVECALQEFKAGRMIIVTDSEHRENEGDLVMAADDITPEAVNFMATEGRGLICVPITQERSDALHLFPMVRENEDHHRTAFTVSVDARRNVTTGISAHDRFETIRLLADEKAHPADFVRPGHIFPLVAREGGVLVRAGHTEASVDLARLAGKKPVAVICEILKPDGSMARMDDLKLFATKHKLKIVTIESLIEYRRKREQSIQLAFERTIDRDGQMYSLKVFTTPFDDRVHFALVKGEFSEGDVVPVRVQNHNLLESLSVLLQPGESDSLRESFEIIRKRPNGAVILIGEDKEELLEFLHGETRESEERILRNIGVGAQILHFLGIRKIALLAHSSKKVVGLDAYNLEIAETILL